MENTLKDLIGKTFTYNPTNEGVVVMSIREVDNNIQINFRTPFTHIIFGAVSSCDLNTFRQFFSLKK